MAYVDAYKREKIKEALKKVIPAHWRYSVRIEHQSTVCLTITQVDRAFMDGVTESEYTLETYQQFGSFKFNHHWPKTICSGESLAIMERVIEALNTDNYRDDSEDPDTLHVGHYVDIYFGKQDGKPLTVLEPDRVDTVVKKLPANVKKRKMDRVLAKIEKALPAETAHPKDPTVDLNW